MAFYKGKRNKHHCNNIFLYCSRLCPFRDSELCKNCQTVRQTKIQQYKALQGIL